MINSFAESTCRNVDLVMLKVLNYTKATLNPAALVKAVIKGFVFQTYTAFFL